MKILRVVKRLFPFTLMLIGVAFIASGAYTVSRGLEAKNQVRGELRAQEIKTPADASIPNARVDGILTARSMADVIDHHVRKTTGGLTYAEMGRYMTADGAPLGTSDPEAAVKGQNGRPVNNPLRNVAFEATTLRTGLYTSVMALEMGNLVVGLGAMIAVVGFALGGLGLATRTLLVPALARPTETERVHTDTRVPSQVLA